MLVGWSCVVSWVVVVVGPVGCLSLLLMASLLFIASHFELNSDIVNQVVSLANSLLSLMDLVEVVFPYLGRSSLFLVPILLG